MNTKQIAALLDSEIQWCQSHPTAEKSVDFQIGFIAGLQQAKFIIINAFNHHETGDLWNELFTDDRGNTIDESGRVVNDDGPEVIA
jgi:hypothetical protein